MGDRILRLVGLFILSFIMATAVVLMALFPTDSPSGSLLPAVLYFLSVALGTTLVVSEYYSTEQRIKELSASRGNVTAESVLRTCRATGAPYAVYLRSFSLEGLSEPVMARVFNSWGGAGRFSARKVEQLLLERLGGLMPILALPDPSYPFHTPGCYRFRRVEKPWPNFVEGLLKGASLIIIYPAGKSPGLATEMSLIGEMGLDDKVLIVSGTSGSSFSNVGTLVHDRETLANQLAARLQNVGAVRTSEQLAAQGLVIIVAAALGVWISVKLSRAAAPRPPSYHFNNARLPDSFKTPALPRLTERPGREAVTSEIESHFRRQGYVVLATVKSPRVIEIQFFEATGRAQASRVIDEDLRRKLCEFGFTRIAITDSSMNQLSDLAGCWPHQLRPWGPSGRTADAADFTIK